MSSEIRVKRPENVHTRHLPVLNEERNELLGVSGALCVHVRTEQRLQHDVQPYLVIEVVGNLKNANLSEQQIGFHRSALRLQESPQIGNGTENVVVVPFGTFLLAALRLLLRFVVVTATLILLLAVRRMFLFFLFFFFVFLFLLLLLLLLVLLLFLLLDLLVAIIVLVVGVFLGMFHLLLLFFLLFLLLLVLFHSASIIVILLVLVVAALFVFVLIC